MKKILLSILLLISTNSVFALEDCLITTNGKLTDIKIENNKILDVCPLITIMNDKNTLIVHPLEIGKTRFCVLKNDKDISVFNVEIKENKTVIEKVDGYEILPIDEPPSFFEDDLDLPPMGK